MKEIARQLRSIIVTVEPQLSLMNHDDMGFKPSPNEWSKKEILGHLIDSAANNHQRFVRAVNKIAVQFPTYDQDEWVRIQRYSESPWPPLVALWSAYNNHLSHVIECIPEDAESSPCNIGKEDSVPLNLVIKDYLRHLLHHLKDMLHGIAGANANFH
jgi:DinB superfamily